MRLLYRFLCNFLCTCMLVSSAVLVCCMDMQDRVWLSVSDNLRPRAVPWMCGASRGAHARTRAADDRPRSSQQRSRTRPDESPLLEQPTERVWCALAHVRCGNQCPTLLALAPASAAAAQPLRTLAMPAAAASAAASPARKANSG